MVHSTVHGSFNQSCFIQRFMVHSNCSLFIQLFMVRSWFI